MIVENLGVEANLFLGGESVEHAADGIHFTSDGFSGAALGAFENHVLHKMSKAILLRGFASGAVTDPNPDGNRADMPHGLGHHDQTVR